MELRGVLKVGVPGGPVLDQLAPGGRRRRGRRRDERIWWVGEVGRARKALGVSLRAGGALCAAVRQGILAVEAHGLAPALGLRRKKTQGSRLPSAFADCRRFDVNKGGRRAALLREARKVWSHQGQFLPRHKVGL